MKNELDTLLDKLQESHHKGKSNWVTKKAIFLLDYLAKIKQKSAILDSKTDLPHQDITINCEKQSKLKIS